MASQHLVGRANEVAGVDGYRPPLHAVHLQSSSYVVQLVTALALAQQVDFVPDGKKPELHVAHEQSPSVLL